MITITTRALTQVSRFRLFSSSVYLLRKRTLFATFGDKWLSVTEENNPYQQFFINVLMMTGRLLQ